MLKAVIFDCFGVIITDAMLLVRQELNTRDPEAGRQMHDLMLAANRGLITPEEAHQGIAGLLGVDADELYKRLNQGEAKDQQLLGYILELRHSLKTAMLSNITRSGLEKRFSSEELAAYFDVVVVSGDIGYAKPEAQAYETVASRLGVRLEECLFVDDRETYCEAARGVGMQAVQYQSFGQIQEQISTQISLLQK